MNPSRLGRLSILIFGKLSLSSFTSTGDDPVEVRDIGGDGVGVAAAQRGAGDVTAHFATETRVVDRTAA